MRWLFFLLMTSVAAASPAALRDVEWRLATLGGAAPPSGAVVTLTVTSEGRAYGAGGCNRFIGSAEVVEDRLRFGQLAGTMMACEDAKMALEQRWHAALAAVRRYAVEGATLRLLGEDGSVLAVLQR